ncbi:hypothetical protein [Candidatus Poriferisodalis sp.]|uniref:hypothetical protein n=1 Tax=Candidatus Poriferisodalis sp. TaxID=3101277 RepID=UPI003B59CF96
MSTNHCPVGARTCPVWRTKLPGIGGIDSYEGHTFHTSRWDYDYTGGNFEGKLGNPDGFFTAMYGAGPIKFFRILDE